MSTVKVYQRKQGRQLGSAMEKIEPHIQHVCAPETPEKPPSLPARPQLVYVKRPSELDSESFLARIAAEEARDPIRAIITSATSTSENGHSNNSSTPVDDCKYLDSGAGFQIDLNESDNSTTAVHGSQTFGDSREGLSEDGFQSEKHNLLSIPDLEESDTDGEQCFVLPYGKKQDAGHGTISHMNDEKVDHIGCSKPLEPVAISTPSPKKSGSKRPNNGMDPNKRPAKKPKGKKHRTKVAVEGKPKRTPKKMPKLATPKRIQEKKEKRKHVKKLAITGCMQEKKEKRKNVKKAPPSIRSSQESSVTDDHKEVAEIREMENLPVTEDHKEVAEMPKMENLPVDDNKMAMVSNVNHDLKDENKLGLDSIQPDMDNNCGAMVLLSGDNLGLESNQNELTWKVRAKRSAGEYWPKPGCQYNSLQAYRWIFTLDSCLSNSRKVGPNVPERCMKRRIKRRRKLNMFSSLQSSHFGSHKRKKRSKVFTKRVDFTSLIVRFVEKEKDLVTASPDNIPIPEGQGFQTTDKPKGENRETLTEGRIEEGLSLEQALTTEVNGVLIVSEAKAQSCSEMGPSAVKSNFQDGNSKQQLRKKKIRITDKSIKLGQKVFDEESCIFLKTVKLSVMHKLGDILRNLSINNDDNNSDRRGPGRPKSKPEHLVDGQNALVPYRGRGRAKHEVDLDPESLRMWNQLMKIDSGVGEEEEKDRKRKEWWRRERIIFNGRINAFTSKLHLHLGDRRFKQWKGSVVDSVVGVFLTQNVSDNLSSSAYMSLVEKFPVWSTSNQQESMTTDGQKSIDCSITSIGATYDSDGNRYFVTEVPEPDMNQGPKDLPAEKATSLLQEELQRQNDIVRSEPEPDMNHRPEDLPAEKAIRLLQEEVQRQNGIVRSEPEPVMNHRPEDLPAEKAIRLLQEEVQRQNGIVRSEPEPDMNHRPEDLPAEKAIRLLQEEVQRQNGIVRSEPEPDMNHGPKDLPAEKATCLLQEDVQIQNGIVRSEPEPDMNLVPQNLPAEQPICLPCEVVQRQPQKLPAERPIWLPRELLQGQSGKETCDETGNKNRSQNGKAASKETKKTTPRGKTKIVKDMVLRRRNWESLGKIYSRPRSKDQMDSVDWEAVRQAETREVASIIEARGQQTIIAGRIKEFLDRVVDMHKSIDLEWLRYAPPDDVKEYLLEFMGLGLKSVECIRLLSLQQVAFPVDINVARIAVRLGWVPLKPLPGSLQFHLIEEFPILDSIQKYLWPRLCVLEHRTLYELHYHMITFGKVFCTKRNPKCHACPMKAECKHYASEQASAANLSLPGASSKSVDKSIVTSKPNGNSSSLGKNCVVKNPMSATLLDGNKAAESGPNVHTCEPIVEEPKSPQQEDIEDFSWDKCIEDEDEDGEIPTIKLNREEFNPNGKKTPYSNFISQALVSVGATPLSAPKMKHMTSLRTEHQVYELPDNHELLAGLERREKDDSVPYLLAIWQPGETPNSSQQPEKLCNSLGSQLCDQKTCFACEGIQEQKAGIVRGTILIPCRTAMKGSFPLNGTYFQVNEVSTFKEQMGKREFQLQVFADHKSSHDPIIVPRELLWNLRKRTLYVGTSTSSIFRGLSLEEIHQNFWTGFTCVRAFERGTGAPKPLVKRFHCSPSKMEKKGRKKTGAVRDDAKAITLKHAS